jgi:site-specific recombinase XerD
MLLNFWQEHWRAPMKVKDAIDDHILYLESLSRSHNTIKSRQRDLVRLEEFLSAREIHHIGDVGPRDLWAFMAHVCHVPKR